jgi:hypothetical protein
MGAILALQATIGRAFLIFFKDQYNTNRNTSTNKTSNESLQKSELKKMHAMGLSLGSLKKKSSTKIVICY